MNPLQLVCLVVLSILLSSCSGSGSNTDQSTLPIDEASIEMCPTGALYDAQEDACYIDCTDLSDDQCDALDQSVFGEFDEFIDDEFSGPGVAGQDQNAESQTIATYTVNTELNLTNIQNDQPENELQFLQIWQSAKALLPQSTLKQALSEFHISTDGVEGTLAYVNTDENQPEKWIIAFDNADYSNDRDPEFIHTTIHEFGHIVFLGNGQVNMNELGDCPNYSISEGCSTEASYINRFYQQFWRDIFAEHQVTVGPEESEDGITEFYEKYEDQFVSDYAATNPVEDAAEVFTRFVLGNKPAEGGSVAQEKIRSLYAFEELVKLRGVIRGKLNAMR